MTERFFRYEVGLSFAGEQREYVTTVAGELKSRGIRVFFDDYEKGTLWGKDLYAHLSDIYENMCRYCVIFISKDYAAKVWPNQERKSAQSRAVREKQEYILPAKFDDTPVPGLLDTIAYIDLTQTSPSNLCDLIDEKLAKHTRSHYLPPSLDRLFDRLGIEGDCMAQDDAQLRAEAFLEVLQRMTRDERRAVISLIRFACPADLPDNLHINADLLQRYTGQSIPSLKRLLGGVRSLGIICAIREESECHTDLPGLVLGKSDLFFLEWVDLSDSGNYPELLVVREMIEGAIEDVCDNCGAGYLERLDFSQLATVTAQDELH